MWPCTGVEQTRRSREVVMVVVSAARLLMDLLEYSPP